MRDAIKCIETTRFHTKLFVEMMMSTTCGCNNLLQVCSKSKDWKVNNLNACGNKQI